MGRGLQDKRCQWFLQVYFQGSHHKNSGLHMGTGTPSLSLNTDSWKQIPFASVGVVFLSLSVHRRIPNAFFFYNVPTYSSLDEANHISLLSAA